MNIEQIINKLILSGTLDVDNINSTNLFKAVRMIPFNNQGVKSLSARSIKHLSTGEDSLE